MNGGNFPLPVIFARFDSGMRFRLSSAIALTLRGCVNPVEVLSDALSQQQAAVDAIEHWILRQIHQHCGERFAGLWQGPEQFLVLGSEGGGVECRCPVSVHSASPKRLAGRAR